MIWLVFVATLSFASAEFLNLDDSIRIFCKICGENITTMDHLGEKKNKIEKYIKLDTIILGGGVIPYNLYLKTMTKNSEAK